MQWIHIRFKKCYNEQMKPFENLESRQEKIEALLATAYESVPQNLIAEWLGIRADNQSELAEMQRDLEPYRTGADKHGEALYWIPQDTQQEVLQRLNVETKSVHHRIAETALAKVRKAREKK